MKKYPQYSANPVDIFFKYLKNTLKILLPDIDNNNKLLYNRFNLLFGGQ